MLTGEVLGIVAGIGFGLFQTMNRIGLRYVGVAEATLLQVLFAAVALGVAVALSGEVSSVDGDTISSFGWFAAGGFLNWGAGIALLGLSQRWIGAVRTGPLLATTPLFGTVLALALFGETPTVLAVVGMLVMFAGVYAGNPRGAASAEGVLASGAPRGAPSVLPGLGTALCWAASPLLIKEGFDTLESPLLGVTVGLFTVAVVYAAGLLLLPSRFAWRRPSRRVVAVEAVAGVLVGYATFALWKGLASAPVGVVLALALLQVPTVMLLAPLVTRGSPEGQERLTRAAAASAGLILLGALIVLLS